jgi:hypothetical protein
MQAQDNVFWVTGFPECGYVCALEVRFEDDTIAETVESFVARVRAQDSVENDPAVRTYGPGPARRLMLGNESALVVAKSCGGCMGAFVFSKRFARIARVEITIDEREVHQAELMTRLLKVAETFRWAEPP